MKARKKWGLFVLHNKGYRNFHMLKLLILRKFRIYDVSFLPSFVYFVTILLCPSLYTTIIPLFSYMLYIGVFA